MAKSCSDQEFVDLFRQLGAAGTARELGIADRNVRQRRRTIERAYDIILSNPKNKNTQSLPVYPSRIALKIQDGVALVGSDAHIWPDDRTPAMRGFFAIIERLKPKLICLNGDVKDGAMNSRHPASGWSRKPKVNEELEAIQETLEEIEDLAEGSQLLWNLGNHDMRFEAKLAQQIPEYEGIAGFALRDHFPKWKFGISAWINDQVVLKHRFKGGIHATHNNTLWAGKSIVTGHLHSLKVTPFDDYNGTRWGIDSGTLSNPYGEHTSYNEDNPLNHRSGFIVLTFRKGVLLWPEVCAVVDEKHVQFRGELIRV